MSSARMSALRMLVIIATFMVAGGDIATSRLPPSVAERTTTPLPVLVTKADVERYVNTMQQEFRKEMSKTFIKKFTKRSADAGRLQSQIDGVAITRVHEGMNVSATDFFTLNGNNYAVISEKTLSGSYIGLVSRYENGSLHIQSQARFSLDSFVDHQYSSTYQTSLQRAVIRLKARVFGGQVFILTELESGMTLLFLVSEPQRSWQPKYQDSVLSAGEVASDFCFFEQKGQLRAVVTVSHRRLDNGDVVPTTSSYIYQLKDGIKWLATHTVPSTGGASSVTTFTDNRWTYIVIGQNDKPALLYRLHWDSGTLELFQRLSSVGLTAVRAFTHQTQTYVLAVPRAGAPTVFWWSSDQLYEWQSLGSDSEEIHFGHVGTFYNGESFICLVTQTRVQFFTTFTSETGHFSLASTLELPANTSVRHVQTTLVGRDGYVLVSTASQRSADWREAHLLVREAAAGQRSAMPRAPGSDELLSCLDEADKLLNALDRQLDQLLELADSVFVSDEPRNITGDVTITGELSVHGEADIEQLQIANHQHGGGNLDAVHLNNVHERIVQSEAEIKDINAGLQSTLSLTGDQIITGNYSFSKLVVRGSIFINDASHIETLNEASFQRLQNSTLTYTGHQTLSYPITIASGSVTSLTADKGATLNGIPISDLMYVSGGHQTVTGHHQYLQLGISGDLRVDGLANGVNLSSALLLGQTLTVPTVTLSQASADTLLVTNVNQKNLAAWQMDVISLDRSHTLSGAKLGGREVVFSSVHIGLLNGRPLDEFLASLWKSPNQGVAGVTSFLGPLTVGELTVDRVNGASLSTDLLTTDTDQTVESHLRLDSLQATLDVNTDWVNGLQLATDVVRTTGHRRPTGSIVFAADLAVTGDVTADDDVTINGLDVSEVAAIANGTRRHTLRFSRAVTIAGNWTVTGDLRIHSVNGYELDRLDDVFWTKDGDQEIDVPVSVDGELTVLGNLSVGTINGISTDQLIDVTRGGTLYGDVIFLGDVTTSHVTLPEGGTVNGRRFGDWAATVVTSGSDQIIGGEKVFSGPVRTAEMSVRDLNGLRVPEDLVLLDTASMQTGSLTFLKDLEVVSNVSSSGDVDVTGSINGYSVRDILANITDVWVNRTTNHVLIIEGNVHFHDIEVVERMSTQGVPALLDGLLFTDRDTRIPGKFTVDGDITVHSDLSLSMVNGLPWAGYLSSVILSDVGGTVAGTTAARSLVSVERPGHILATSLNGYTLQRLYNQHLTLHTHQLIRRPVTVIGTVNADVLVVNSVNNVPVDQLMFTDRDIHFYQSVHFFSDLATFELDVYGGVIGDCNLTKIWENGLRKSAKSQKLQASSIDSLIVKGDVIVSDADVSGKLRTLFDRIVTKTGNHNITGEVTFERPLSVEAAEVDSYNGHSLDGLFNDALTTDVNGTVTISQSLTLLGPVTFRGDINVAGDVTVGLLNGEGADQFVASLVLQGQEDVTLSGPLRFQRDAVAGHVLAPGPINGEPQSPWVEKDADLIMEKLYFDHGVTVEDELDVTGLVGGVNVTDVLENALCLDEDATVEADVIFNGSITAWMDLNVPVINGLDLDKDVLLTHVLDRVQTVSGAKHFETLVIAGDVCAGTLNGERVSELCDQLLDAGEGAVQVVTQPLAFKHHPAGMEESPSSRLANNMTAVSTRLRESNEHFKLWTQQTADEMTRVRDSAGELLHAPDYSVDLAYLLEVQRVPVVAAVAVRSWGGDQTDSLEVLLRSREDCDLPAGCLCRATNTLQIENDGLLIPPGSTEPGQTWTFHVRDVPRQLVSVTAHTEDTGFQCRSPDQPRVSVTICPAEDTSAAPRDLPLADPPSGHVSDVQLFTSAGRLYLVLAYDFAAEGDGYIDTEVLVLAGDDQWHRVQRLPAFAAYRLDLTLADGVPHLLVVNRHSREELSMQGEVQLWAWNSDHQQFSELRALYHSDIQAVTFLHAHEKVYVVIGDLDGLTVLEYSPEDHQYSVCQYLAEPGVAAVTSFIVGAESYLVVFSSKLNEMVVFLVTHQEGLRRHGWYPAVGVRSLTVYSGGRDLLLAAVHQHGLVVYRLVLRGRLSLAATSAARLPPPTS